MPADFELMPGDTDRPFARMGRARPMPTCSATWTRIAALFKAGALDSDWAQICRLQRRRQRGRRDDRRHSTGGGRESLAALRRPRLRRGHRRAVRPAAHVPGHGQSEDRRRRHHPLGRRCRAPSSPASASAWASPSERAPRTRRGPPRGPRCCPDDAGRLVGQLGRRPFEPRCSSAGARRASWHFGGLHRRTHPDPADAGPGVSALPASSPLPLYSGSTGVVVDIEGSSGNGQHPHRRWRRDVPDRGPAQALGVEVAHRRARPGHRRRRRLRGRSAVGGLARRRHVGAGASSPPAPSDRTLSGPSGTSRIPTRRSIVTLRRHWYSRLIIEVANPMTPGSC